MHLRRCVVGFGRFLLLNTGSAVQTRYAAPIHFLQKLMVWPSFHAYQASSIEDSSR
uniref:Uncharacterized protein n=1 Tax=Setaria viridis TaxID=4556 RepID=A0A4U6TM74_SETVI|nr:hypothetical protein SEVIR_8G232033v2 [Setaria viridis]